ncbi:MAG: hypothetical protein V2I74_02275 [Erythrobacter sp.]|nr:hypothetical protein [Erythrobacter sp.]
MISTWTLADPDGNSSEELLVAFDRGRDMRVLISPAWFDEANKLRRFTIEVMRRLEKAGIDSFLPDLPGCNESLAPLESQTLAGWRAAMNDAADRFGATHVLGIRAGALLAPVHLPGWHYASQSGTKLLRAMLRARTISAREAGREEKAEALLTLGRSEGLTLGGWPLGAALIRELECAEPLQADGHSEIAQSVLGGPGLWLRAEPDEDAAQADALAAIIAGTGA